MKCIGMGISRGVEGMIYPPSGYGVPIPYHKMTSPNTRHGFEVLIPVNRPR